MDQIKKAVVALDLSAMDDRIIKYVNIIAKPLRLLRLDFVHVIPEEYIQTGREYGMPEGTSLLNAVNEKVRNAIQEKINAFLPDTDLDIQIHVIEGHPRKQILKYIDEQGVDLLIAGRKSNSDGSGITVKRIARNAKCHFLFVPENISDIPRRVMVPIDFSDNSAEAVYAALALKVAIPDLEIVCPHVMKMLPADFYYELDKYQFFIDANIEKSKKAYQYFIKEYDLPEEELEEVLLEDNFNSVGKKLTKYLEKEGFDMVIMGAQGHKWVDRMIYGSVTERFVQSCDKVPLFVTRYNK